MRFPAVIVGYYHHDHVYDLWKAVNETKMGPLDKEPAEAQPNEFYGEFFLFKGGVRGGCGIVGAIDLEAMFKQTYAHLSKGFV